MVEEGYLHLDGENKRKYMNTYSTKQVIKTVACTSTCMYKELELEDHNHTAATCTCNDSLKVVHVCTHRSTY